MATITIYKTTQGVHASIAGNINSSTQRILQSYIERKKLDVQSTTIKSTFGYTPTYQDIPVIELTRHVK